MRLPLCVGGLLVITRFVHSCRVKKFIFEEKKIACSQGVNRLASLKTRGDGWIDLGCCFSFLSVRVCVCFSIFYADGFRKTIVCAIQKKSFSFIRFRFFVSLHRSVCLGGGVATCGLWT